MRKLVAPVFAVVVLGLSGNLIAQTKPPFPLPDPAAKAMSHHRQKMNEVVGLRSRLAIMRAKHPLRKRFNTNAPELWVKFSREFERDRDAIEKSVWSWSLQDRILYIDALDWLNRMYKASIERDVREYEKCYTYYRASLMNLENHVIEWEKSGRVPEVQKATVPEEVPSRRQLTR